MIVMRTGVSSVVSRYWAVESLATLPDPMASPRCPPVAGWFLSVNY
jgi:hypothetical protein